MIELLKKLVSINSAFPNEEKIGNFLYNKLIDLGFNTQKQYISENRFNILAEKGKGEKSYLLYGHLDTVQPSKDWKNNPFELNINGDIAIGLGTADMKGGLTAILEAIRDVEPQNYKLKVCFGVDEENYSEGAFKLTQTSWLDDVKGVLVPESSLPAHKSKKAGCTITLGRKGRCVYLVKIWGKTSHGVEIKNGINAIEESSKLVFALKDFQTLNNPNSYFIRRFESKSLSLSIPEYAELEIDCHLVYPENSISLKEKLEKYILSLQEKEYQNKNSKFELSYVNRPTPFLEPFSVDENNNFVKIVTQAVRKIYEEYYYNYGNSVADENIFGNLGIPTLTVGALGDNHHCAEEWVSLESIKHLIGIYKLVLQNLEEIN